MCCLSSFVGTSRCSRNCFFSSMCSSFDQLRRWWTSRGRTKKASPNLPRSSPPSTRAPRVSNASCLPRPCATTLRATTTPRIRLWYCGATTIAIWTARICTIMSLSFCVALFLRSRCLVQRRWRRALRRPGCSSWHSTWSWAWSSAWQRGTSPAARTSRGCRAHCVCNASAKRSWPLALRHSIISRRTALPFLRSRRCLRRVVASERAALRAS